QHGVSSSWTGGCLRSGLALQEQADRFDRAVLGHRHQLPALRAQPVQLLLGPTRCLVAAEQAGLDLDYLVLPARTHGSCSVLSARVPARGSLPALRSASRSTYSICALRLRSSSSAQRCAAARTSALMRSG